MSGNIEKLYFYFHGILFQIDATEEVVLFTDVYREHIVPHLSASATAHYTKLLKKLFLENKFDSVCFHIS